MSHNELVEIQWICHHIRFSRWIVTNLANVLFESTFQPKILATTIAQKLHAPNDLACVFPYTHLDVLVTLGGPGGTMCPAHTVFPSLTAVTQIVSFQIFTALEFQFAGRLTVVVGSFHWVNQFHMACQWWPDHLVATLFTHDLSKNMIAKGMLCAQFNIEIDFTLADVWSFFFLFASVFFSASDGRDGDGNEELGKGRRRWWWTRA